MLLCLFNCKLCWSGSGNPFVLNLLSFPQEISVIFCTNFICVPHPYRYPSTTMASYAYHDSEQGEILGNDVQFSEKTIRLGFIRKVYGILSIQLVITMGFIALFLFQEDVKFYSQKHPEMYITAMVLTFALIIVLACCEGVRRKHPWNLVLLTLFTLCEGWMLGAVASAYKVEEVLLAVGIVAVITLVLTAFAMQTKYDFTAMGGFLLVALVVLLLFSIIAIIWRSNVVNIVYASLGALLFGFYLVFDTQLMLGGKHKYAISPEEHIFAALNLYLDIINMFLYILSIIGNANRS